MISGKSLPVSSGKYYPDSLTKSPLIDFPLARAVCIIISGLCLGLPSIGEFLQQEGLLGLCFMLRIDANQAGHLP